MRAILQTGGGKDSILALHKIKEVRPEVEVIGMLVTFTWDYRRVSMHGVREELIEKQAEAVGLPLFKSYIPKDASNEIYIKNTTESLESLKSEMNIEAVIFGDIFLEDIRKFREKLLEPLDLEPIFPLWGIDTGELAREFIGHGFNAKTVVVDLEKLSDEFLCRDFDEEFLRDLPDGVDPMGENGEFHTFVYDGPLFSRSIEFEEGEIRDTGRFKFCDLVPIESS